MSFINSTQALILGAAAAAAVVALYFLKLKRREHVVPSTLLWRRSINDLAVNAPFQRLRSSLLLILQILIVALAALALARPVLNLRQTGGGDAIMLIDTSSSMNTTEPGGTRLDLAKKTARGLLQQMDASASMMVLTFAGQCNVQQSFTGSKSDLGRAIAAIEPGEGPTNIRDALAVALHMSRSRRLMGRKDQQIVIISDGGFDDPQDLQRENIPVRFLPVGRSTRNAAITNLDVRRTASQAAEIFVGVENFSPEPFEGSISIYDRGAGEDAPSGGLLRTVPVSLGPREKGSRLFSVPQLADTLVEIVLEPGDDLASDNRAWVPLRKPREPNVLLVTSGNYFLEKALMPDANSPHHLAMIQPVDYPPATPADVTVFDRWSPPSIGSGGYLFMGCVPPIAGVEPAGEVDYPVLLDWDHSDPLCRFADFTGLQVAKARAFKLPIHSVALEGDKCPLVVSISTVDRRVVLVAFELINAESRLNTNWPFRVSFPVFFSNAIHWLNPEVHGAAPAMIQVGSPITFNLPADCPSAAIRDPRGTITAVEADKERRVAFGKTAIPGPYLLTMENRDPVWTAANVLDRRESSIKPRESFEWRGAPITGEDTVRQTPREIWKYLVIIALCLLMAEWYVYHRHWR